MPFSSGRKATVVRCTFNLISQQPFSETDAAASFSSPVHSFLQQFRTLHTQTTGPDRLYQPVFRKARAVPLFAESHIARGDDRLNGLPIGSRHHRQQESVKTCLFLTFGQNERVV